MSKYAPIYADAPNPDLELLVDMHRYMRPKGSRTEQLFVDTFIMPLGVKPDLYGNLHKIVAPKDAAVDWKPDVLWSSHTDTVHTFDGFQRVVVDANGRMTLHKNEAASCLGADDGAGIWLMMEMIRAGVPGHYVFHYGEEKGCEGATKLSKHGAEIFKDIKIAIAFDRRGTDSIITRMQSNKVCSVEFADSLAKQLPNGYKPDPSGSRTDVALYREIIPECTNISVGYLAMHSRTESLDTHHLINLRDHLIKIDTSKLVVKRDPKEKEYSTGYSQGGYNNPNTSYHYDCRPRRFSDLFRDAPELCQEMMEAAGINFDVFLSFALKQQETKTRTYSTLNRKVIPYAAYRDPLPNNTGVKPAPAVEGNVGASPAPKVSPEKVDNVVPLNSAAK